MSLDQGQTYAKTFILSATLGCAARENMLMRFAKVAPDGAYTPPPAENSKASYSTMVYVRSTIVEDAGWHLAKATTIAVSHNNTYLPISSTTFL